MTDKTDNECRYWRRAVTGAMAGLLAVGFLMGAGTTPVLAQPSNSSGSTETDSETEAAEPTMTGAQALAIVARDYDTGHGGGQVSKLIHDVLTLYSRGFRPSKSNEAALVAALDKRPNQKPLVEALRGTLAYQRKMMARSVNAGSSSPVTVGTPAAPGAAPGSPAFVAPGTSIQQPLVP